MKAIFVRTLPREAFKRFQLLPTLTPEMAVRPANAFGAPLWPWNEPELTGERDGLSAARTARRESPSQRCVARA